MSRPLRIEYPDAWHHVMSRSRRGEKVFKDNADYLCFLDLLQETSDLFNIRVAAYCFMPTHYHLLVQTPDMNLARCMRHINGVYTQRHHARHKCDGTLFRGRYKSIIVDADSYLLQLVRYIHKNPVNAGLAEKPDQYQWSSHKGYISNAKKWDWLYCQFVLNMLTPHKNQQIRKYKQFMAEDISEEINRVFDNKYLPSMLGSEKFVQWVKNKFFRQKRHMEVPDSKALAPDTETIIEAVCKFYEIGRDKLFAIKRGTENEPRHVAIYLIRTIRADPLLKIGALFNLKKHSSVSSAVVCIKTRLEKDRKFRKRFHRINNMIYKGQSEI